MRGKKKGGEKRDLAAGEEGEMKKGEFSHYG